MFTHLDYFQVRKEAEKKWMARRRPRTGPSVCGCVCVGFDVVSARSLVSVGHTCQNESGASTHRSFVRSSADIEVSGRSRNESRRGWVRCADGRVESGLAKGAEIIFILFFLFFLGLRFSLFLFVVVVLLCCCFYVC